MSIRVRVTVVLVVALLLAACSNSFNSVLTASDEPSRQTAGNGVTRERQLAEPGLRALAEGNYAEAVTRFEVALQAAPDSADLHFLVGFSYSRMSNDQSATYRPLAETAFQVALRLNPAHAAAARELGSMMLRDGRYELAEYLYSRAVSLGMKDPVTYRGLAMAAYYNVDFPVAHWATAQVADGDPNSIRLRALVEGLGGNRDAARDLLQRYQQVDRTESHGRALQVALTTWEDLHEQVAQMPAWGAAAPQPTPPPPPSGPAVSAATGPMATNWSDCVQASNPVSTNMVMGGGGGQASADETVLLPALPSPCSGRALPRMALIDVVLIRTIINGTSTEGLNLLDQLQVVMGGSLVTSHAKISGTAPSNVSTFSKAFNLGIPTSGIDYSLNIANATGTRSEVLSRPSLLALDRQPSVFFSGSTVTVALQGQLGGGSFGQLPVGVNLSATPTFIDDDTLLITVKATRSFFETVSGGSFSEALQTSRNSVTANAIMKMGQTLVLSGLSDRETQDVSSHVPVLGQVPGLKYLFNNSSDDDFRTYILVLLTPRRAGIETSPGEATLAADSLAEQDKAQLDFFRKHAANDFQPVKNIDAIKYHLRTNQLYKVIAGGNIDSEMWPGSSERFQFMNELEQLLYF